MQSLKHLSLANSKLGKIVIGLANCQHLVSLDMSDNELSDDDAQMLLSDENQLERLAIGGNNFSDVPAIIDLANRKGSLTGDPFGNFRVNEPELTAEYSSLLKAATLFQHSGVGDDFGLPLPFTGTHAMHRVTIGDAAVYQLPHLNSVVVQTGFRLRDLAVCAEFPVVNIGKGQVRDTMDNSSDSSIDELMVAAPGQSEIMFAGLSGEVSGDSDTQFEPSIVDEADMLEVISAGLHTPVLDDVESSDSDSLEVVQPRDLEPQRPRHSGAKESVTPKKIPPPRRSSTGKLTRLGKNFIPVFVSRGSRS
jgi:Leucine-rich repeat (LRR) protein